MDDDALALDDEEAAELALSPLERRPRREPQTYQELSPQLDFLYRASDQFSQWVQFADAKAGGVVLVLSIGALDLFRHADDFIHAHRLAHPVWGWLSLVALFFSGAFDGISMVIRKSIVRAMAPEHMRGRVAAVSSVFIGASNELGAFESGFAAKLLGTVRSVWLGGVVTLVVVTGAAALAPRLRRLNLTGGGVDADVGLR